MLIEARIPAVRLVLFTLLVNLAAANMGNAVAAELPAVRLRLRVVDREAGAPIGGARVWSFLFTDRLELESRPTDDSGWTDVPLPARAGWKALWVRVRKDGFAPFRLVWDETQMGMLPDDHEVALEPGGTIGGRVIDKAGNPIEGAEVFLMATMKPIGESVDLEEEPFTTGQDGTWRCDFAPTDLGGVRRRVMHPDHLHVPYSDLDPGKARSREDVVVLEKGPVVRGRVIGPDATPIEGARVLEGKVIWRMPSGTELGKLNELRTDAKGEFRLGSARPGGLDLLIEADGFSPLVEQVAVTDRGASVEFPLRRGRVLRGRVEDPSGVPVGGALVEAPSWKKTRLGWAAITKSDGLFEWTGAPEGLMSATAFRRGWRRLGTPEPAHAERGIIVRLAPLPRLAGKVLDAATGLPIERFLVRTGSIRSGRPKWNRHAFAFSEGRYDVCLAGDDLDSTILRIEADEYFPAVSRPVASHEIAEVMDFRLIRGETVRGRVRDRRGEPVMGASIYRIEDRRAVLVIDGKPSEDLESTQSVRDGTFALSPREEDHGLLVMAESGFAVLSSIRAGASLSLELEPWARLEGELRLGGAARSSEVVALSVTAGSGVIQARYTTATSADGRFTFERLFPGPAEISHEVNVLPRSKRPHLQSTRHAAVRLPREERGLFMLGGSGTTVAGRVVNTANAGGELEHALGYATLRAKVDSEGTLRHYATPLGEDRCFRIEDVEAGDYELLFHLYDPEALIEHGLVGQELAFLSRDVTIQPGANGAAPVDLGSIEITVYRALGPGVPAPSFEVSGVDGKLIRLDDYRGKVVLLDFWATWCGPCVGEIPKLKKLHQKYAANRHVAMIGLSLDESLEPLREFVHKQSMGWFQGFLGNWNASKVRAAYGITSIPRIFLVGADGRIVRADFIAVTPVLEEEIAREIEKALSASTLPNPDGVKRE